MTNKTKEIRHIQQMLVDQKWVKDRVVEDEINNLVFRLAHEVIQADIEKHNKPLCKFLDYQCCTCQGYCTCSPDFLGSLDAIKGLEREGWNYKIDVFTTNDPYPSAFCDTWLVPVFKTKTSFRSPRLPTEQAARLYAILETWIYDLEGEG